MRLFFVLCVLFESLCLGKFYSQCGQDEFVYRNFFKGKKNGTFVDIGAHNGITISNTYFFEKCMNWNGICVEPNSDVFTKLQKNRKCTLVNGCITNWTGPGVYLKITGPSEMLSGLVNKFDQRFLDRIYQAVSKDGSTIEEVEVKCFEFNDVMDQNELTHIHFLSIDTEGGELDILSNIDFNRLTIDVITVENAFKDPRFTTFLALKGFNFVKQLKWDSVFVNKKFRN